MSEAAGTLVNSVFEMAEARTGALIVILGGAGLKGVIETGTPPQAHMSEELLLSIFNTKSPLHDGAVVVQASRLADLGDAGETIVSDSVRLLSAGKDYHFEPWGEVQLKGFDETSTLWKVTKPTHA